MSKRTFHLSASSIQSFKACPQRFRLGYVEGIRKAEDTDAQRVGTNWHELHEHYHNTLAAGGSEDDALQAAVDHLNQRYADTPMPSTKTLAEWQTEQQVLVTSFVGYLWYWGDDPVEPISSELAFDLPVHEPRTGLPLLTSDVIRRGKIDHVVQWKGMVGNVERKSTSRSIAGDSDYWDKAKKDTQVSMYALAFRDMATAGLLPEAVLNHPAFDPARLGNTLYDVWHKPTSKPKALTQKDTAAFIESGTYCGQTFEVEHRVTQVDENTTTTSVRVDGQDAEVEQGKRGIAVRETPAMFGARLLEDIQERPDFYFQRREISRTDAEVRRFRSELFNIYQAQRLYDKTGCWFENEQQCRATFTCQYVPVCYGPGADAVCDGKTTPPGFKRIFDVTVEGADLNEGE